MMVAQVLQNAGADVTVLGRRMSSLQLAEQLGMRVGLTDDFADGSFNLAVEATGNAAGLAHTLRLVPPQGTVVLKSTYADNPTGRFDASCRQRTESHRFALWPIWTRVGVIGTKRDCDGTIHRRTLSTLRWPRRLRTRFPTRCTQDSALPRLQLKPKSQ